MSVRLEGKREVKRHLDYYNLDMIISVGYRVKSHVATRFRIWAIQQLTEFIRKGFLLDDERMKNPDLPFDYFSCFLLFRNLCSVVFANGFNLDQILTSVSGKSRVKASGMC